ncbi:MAG: guanylate kinase [Syntrophaceae bacterium]|nr:guanylate kinase [Syntrophaceae bacterium]
MNNHRSSPEGGIFIVISAPSGTGKTSICREMFRMFPNLRFSVSYTTRRPRPNEIDGQDYHFISEREFLEGIERGEFAEWTENYGNYYGTSKKTMMTFLEQGCDLILDVESAGAKALKENFSPGVFIFIMPPSLEELKVRLRKRGSESDDALERRLRNALNEIKEIGLYDYVIFNDNLEAAVDRFRSIYVAEKCRRERLHQRIKDFFN